MLWDLLSVREKMATVYFTTVQGELNIEGTPRAMFLRNSSLY